MATDPVTLTVDILEAAAALAANLPDVVRQIRSAIGIIQTGTVTEEQEQAIRAELDAIKQRIDTA